MPCRDTRGVALVLALGLVLILAVQGDILGVLSHTASREAEVIHDHLRALSVGEAAFASTVARLGSALWSERWFRSGPVVEEGVPAAKGTYNALIRDTPAPGVVDSVSPPGGGEAVQSSRAFEASRSKQAPPHLPWPSGRFSPMPRGAPPGR